MSADSNGVLDHLLDIQSLDLSIAERILQRAHRLSAGDNLAFETLERRVLINLFYEPSTRTRVSFEMAALRLGMKVINVAASDSSVKKGETLLDTFATLQAMAPDVMVVRHPQNLAINALAEAAEPGLHVVNAGDGSRAHPTQALLDVLTLQKHFPDLGNVCVLVAGDLHHSRVTRSTVALMKRLGVGEVRLCAPPGFEAGPRVSSGAVTFTEFEEALRGVDAVMMLRIQRERVAGMNLPDADHYHRVWGLTESRLEMAAPHCIVMHPGPMNRGVEISSEVADGPRSVIAEQVANGVLVRMAVILELLGVD